MTIPPLKLESKILVMCQRGNCRSVATAFILKDHRGYNNVVTCGVETASLKTRRMLYAWAELIIICGEPELVNKVDPEFIQFMPNLFHLDIGPDIWGNPFNQDLLSKVNAVLKENGI